MAKNKIEYVCTECGDVSPKWSGQCAACKGWNCLTEVVAAAASKGGGRFAGYAGEQAKVVNLGEVNVMTEALSSTGISEMDRVLGGGLVQGSVVLIGGDPGIGKSTLLLQVMAKLAGEMSVLYVSGEESAQQISLRARRLEIDPSKLDLLTETQVGQVLATAQTLKPRVLVVDSIQTIYTEELQSAPGSVAQVRESTARLVRYAKQTGTAIFLVGHVTKEGSLAGPRVLEHMVDTVLYFEGESGSRYRVIRSIKNRFGAVNELGVFAMTEMGLKEVTNPSAIFLSRHEEVVPGTVTLVTREGTRPLLVELQALVDESHLGNPRRVTIGLEQNRLAMLLAVLHRHGGVASYDQDVFINVVGGVRVSEPAADLAVILSILSSLRNRPVAEGTIVFGEVGLVGEVRPIPGGEERLREAAKHGFTRAIIPKANRPRKAIEGLEVVAVSRLSDALNIL
ncbi:MAG: DNA repair protein RadA [Gammaproteobacteria bacterium]|jgi:DNA repair protein RadA/Sms|nr:DNA repair protein RadA [Gammaproteobacteria bacterium]MBT3717477.1 DNA repair protein RadA [Gammaproteobacteria bacterium]MBT3845082.1 DNA repair protein RadA [Gammaproteobacteria bacterium]MBT3893081.1 DNA repair protein RadA [Gammaproteobacteria bacterium]MBT4301246.1 DNA repair protein RadA [Gammaproteobacteria bacterium]